MLPLAIDLDGTLIHVDSLHESLLGAIKREPKNFLSSIGAFRDGKAAFKRWVADVSDPINAASLPYNEDLLTYLKEQKAKGRRIGLFTAADQSIADAIAAHLDIFDIAIGSDGTRNLSGHAKLETIRQEFGERFAYAGDHPVDEPIFRAAEASILVGPAAKLRTSLQNATHIEGVFERERATAKDWIKGLRVHHWAKNLLVFVAPVIGLGILNPAVFVSTVMLFLAMGFLASATYILNDLLDLEADRQHPKKRHRPFAAGRIPARDAILVGVLLGLAAFVIGLLLPPLSFLSLVAYLVVTCSYSFFLKRLPIVDVFTLASLFTLRVFAGSTVLAIPISPWLLTFSMLFFLGLAVVKRYAELDRVITEGGTEVGARGYTTRDLPLLLATGVSSSFGAIILMTIYLIDEQYPSGQFERPGLLWALMPIILIWSLRVWHLTVHGRMNEDPVVFALHDRFSLILGALALMFLLAAWAI